MKPVWILLMIITAVLIPSGCQEATKNVDGKSEAAETDFPEFLVGTWEADASSQAIELGPGGEVIALINSGGLRLVSKDGGARQQGRNTESWMYFIFGDQSAMYDANTRELTVVFEIEEFRIETGDKSITGVITYRFEGPILKDDRTWRVQTLHSVNLEGLIPEDSGTTTESLVFHKITGG